MKKRLDPILAAILGVSLILRVIYHSPGLLGGDSIGYAIGGLGTWIAHPPGFFGYCFTGWLVNQAVADIATSFLLINAVASLLGVWFCHQLAVDFGLQRRAALLATAAYAFSVNVTYFGGITLSYPSEGMFATLCALLCRRALVRRSLPCLLGASFVWAVGGAFRQTTFTFMAPLWAWTVFSYALASWKGGARGGALAHAVLACAVSLPVAYGWTKADAHYLAAHAGDLKADVSHDFWQLAMMMPSDHDYSHLGLDENVQSVATTTYHMPFVEYLTWVDEKTGLHLVPDYRLYNAPPPDLIHASRLSFNQFMKQVFYVIFSLPVVLLLALLIPRPRAALRALRVGEWFFFAAWMIPVGAFFVVGHMGSPGYLQIYLSGMSVLVVLLLTRVFGETSTDKNILSWPKWQLAHIAFAVLSLLFFVSARPFISADPNKKLADILVLQYTGQAARRQFSTARALSNKPGLAEEEKWIWCRSDADILKWWSTQPGAKICLYQPKLVR